MSLLKFGGDLAKRFSFENKVEIDGFKGEYSTPDDIHVLTFEDGGEARWTKVTKFLRRRHEGKILRIRTGTGGRTLRVTPEHKVFVHVDGKLVKKRADELKPGDELLSTWRIPESGAPYTIDLIEAFKSLPEEEKEKTYVRGGIGGESTFPR